MNSRDSIIVSLAVADLRKALLIAHFPISDVSPPLAHPRTSRTLDLSRISLCFRICRRAITTRQITWVFFSSSLSLFLLITLFVSATVRTCYIASPRLPQDPILYQTVKENGHSPYSTILLFLFLYSTGGGARTLFSVSWASQWTSAVYTYVSVWVLTAFRNYTDFVHIYYMCVLRQRTGAARSYSARYTQYYLTFARSRA